MFGIAVGYKENEVISKDAIGRNYWKIFNKKDLWQLPVYKYLASELSKEVDEIRILEIGCGTGHKAVENFGKKIHNYIGLDQESGIKIAQTKYPQIKWKSVDFEDHKALLNQVISINPTHIVCVDVVEHLENPENFFRVLLKIKPGTKIYISTPARELMEKQSLLGPPRNPLHVREWTSKELKTYLDSLGFLIQSQSHFFPRSYTIYSPREIIRIIIRFVSGRKIPDTKSCQLITMKVS